MKCHPALVIPLSMLCMTSLVAATGVTDSITTSSCDCNCSAPSNKASRSPSPPPPSASGQLCGRGHGSCSTPGYCCSSSGTCGYDDAHCVGCQKDYGRCPTLCDGSRPCGVYGMVSFAFSIVSAALLAIGTATQIYLAVKNKSDVIYSYSLISLVRRCQRHCGQTGR